VQQLYQREILIAEQQVCELNPLYSCICDTRPYCVTEAQYQIQWQVTHTYRKTLT